MGSNFVASAFGFSLAQKGETKPIYVSRKSFQFLVRLIDIDDKRRGPDPIEIQMAMGVVSYPVTCLCIFENALPAFVIEPSRVAEEKNSRDLCSPQRGYERVGTLRSG